MHSSEAETRPLLSISPIGTHRGSWFVVYFMNQMPNPGPVLSDLKQSLPWISWILFKCWSNTRSTCTSPTNCVLDLFFSRIMILLRKQICSEVRLILGRQFVDFLMALSMLGGAVRRGVYRGHLCWFKLIWTRGTIHHCEGISRMFSTLWCD